jgi:RHS repeat-associated protein
LDLSGSEDGGGGIGGLLSVLEISGGQTTDAHFAAYDGNGNVSGLVNAGDKLPSARYEYSSYGELLRTTGLMARANPIRFSTKFDDDESNLIYYGHRYFCASLGRWIGRDSEEEGGGNNLFAFVDNAPVGATDALGDHKGDSWPGDVPTWFKEVIEMEKQAGSIDVESNGGVSFKNIRAKWRQYNSEFGGNANRIRGRYGNKRKPWTRGGTEGAVQVRLLVAGAAITAATIAVTYFSAKLALANVRAQAARGLAPDPRSPEAHLYDFARHTDAGDNAWADLDAVAYVISSGHTAGNAAVAWSAIVAEENVR